MNTFYLSALLFFIMFKKELLLSFVYFKITSKTIRDSVALKVKLQKRDSRFKQTSAFADQVLFKLQFYCLSGFGKLLTLWYKKDTFKQLLIELANIWPMSGHDKETAGIKRKKLSRLRIGQFCKFRISFKK